MITPNKILLFDMDGVLLEAGGYHRALQESVALIGKSLGYQEVQVSQEDINLFEAVGITSEWDSAAICSALLLTQLWENGMDVGLPANPVADLLPPHHFDCPDFQSFSSAFARQPNPDASPLLQAEHLLLENKERYNTVQINLLRSMLRGARGIEGSLTYRIFQELVLGSQIFERTYKLPALLGVDSYLQHYDRPLLSPENQSSLHAWLKDKNHCAAIFTNRPSVPPDGFFSTPEAEIGAQTAGVNSLPIVGFGALSWFAFKHGLDLQAFLKPSPIHVLGALWLALQTGSQMELEAEKEERLVIALQVALQAVAGEGRENWSELDGAQVYVFEDAVRGMKSARAAQEVLEKMNIRMQVELCGITESAAKQRSLSGAGAAVYPSVNAALSFLGLIS